MACDSIEQITVSLQIGCKREVEIKITDASGLSLASGEAKTVDDEVLKMKNDNNASDNFSKTYNNNVSKYIGIFFGDKKRISVFIV